MIPYTNFYFFFIVAALLTPTVVAGLLEKPVKRYNSFVTLVFIGIIFSNDFKELSSLILYTIWQVLLVKGYLQLRTRQNKTPVFHLFVVLSILPLFLVKIVPLLQIESTIGFLGISYLTFKSVQMVIEIRDGLIKELNAVDFIRFLLFFPTITSGPIDRFRRFQKDSERRLSRQQYLDLLYIGVNKIFLGFLYKFIIGYSINTYVIETPFAREHSFLATLVYMYAYSLYLFFDFAGYSAFAVGVSYIMGIQTPENFNKPFLSRNIKDFWNRWHMSLSFWFRDYVYMRLVFWLTKNKILQDRYLISYSGYFTLFLLMGLWHGLYLHYIVYGLYHAMLIIGFDLFERRNKQANFWPDTAWTKAVSIFITFNFICFGFLIFSGRLF